jgi:hypothetical protein
MTATERQISDLRDVLRRTKCSGCRENVRTKIAELCKTRSAVAE